MKKILFVSLLIYSSLLGQYQVLAPSVEIFVGTENLTGNVPTFKLEAIGQVWDTELPRTNPIVLTNDFQSATYTPPSNNQYIGSWGGFDFCYSGGDFGFGLYKLYVDGLPTNYILLDYRDDRYGTYDPSTVGSESAQDIWVKYEYDSGSGDYIFYWSTSGNNPSWNAFDVDIWDAKDQGVPTTGKFEPAIPDNFSIDLQSANYPILNWDHSSEADYWIGYKIYRSITDNFDDPRNYSLLATVSKYSTSYSDTEVQFGNWDYAHYYIVVYCSPKYLYRF